MNVAHTVGIEGLTDEESAPLLNFLFQHQIKPEFTCRFQWQPHSLAFWDNRCAQHNPVNDYHGFRRIMHRITLAGPTTLVVEGEDLTALAGGWTLAMVGEQTAWIRPSTP